MPSMEWKSPAQFLISSRSRHSLSTLKEEVNCKTKILLSTELEFRRQLEELDNTESWLERQRSELSQTGFLEAFKLHTAMRSSMCQQVSAETAILDDLHANLAIEGSISIVTQNGESLISQRGGKSLFDAKSSKQGTTELRQQVRACK